MGREVRDLCATAGFSAKLSLVADLEEEAGRLTESEGEPALVGRLDRYSLGEADVVFLAGTADSARQAMALDSGAALIDLTGAAEESPRARIRAPNVEPAGFPMPQDAVHVIANPAAVAITMVLNRLHPRYPVERTVATVFEPASERGRAGVDELQQQVIHLLSFKGLPKAVFGAQTAFNLLARYGEDAPHPLEEAEKRIERHVATLLAQSSQAPQPSLKLIQAPVFHGYSILLWVRFAENPGVQAVEKALSGGDIDVRGGDLDPPDNIGTAGHGGIAAGAISVDRNDSRACWIWVAADNLRLSAENAVAVASGLL
jgi:aspartate-semialdehyde dehydrogenase